MSVETIAPTATYDNRTAFAEELIHGVLTNADEIDGHIRGLAQNWDFDRIAPPSGYPWIVIQGEADLHRLLASVPEISLLLDAGQTRLWLSVQAHEGPSPTTNGGEELRWTISPRTEASRSTKRS